MGRMDENEQAKPATASAPESPRSAPPAARKRAICPRCERPTPRACLCKALPDQRLELEKCHVLVLQHPHEMRRKNRSLFLAEFCLTVNSMTCVRARKWQMATTTGAATAVSNGNVNMGAVTKTLMSTEHSVWLVYPHAQAKPLRQALAERKKLQSTADGDNDSPKTLRPLTLIFLDATWKFAGSKKESGKR